MCLFGEEEGFEKYKGCYFWKGLVSKSQKVKVKSSFIELFFRKLHFDEIKLIRIFLSVF